MRAGLVRRGLEVDDTLRGEGRWKGVSVGSGWGGGVEMDDLHAGEGGGGAGVRWDCEGHFSILKELNIPAETDVREEEDGDG